MRTRESLRTAEGACHCTVSMPHVRFSQVPMIWTSCGTVSRFRVPKIHFESTGTWMRTRDKFTDCWWNLPFYFVCTKYVNLLCWLYSLCNVIEYFYCICNFYFHLLFRWNKLVQKPYEEGDERGLKLLQSILKPIMLRRTKNSTDKEGRYVQLWLWCIFFHTGLWCILSFSPLLY